jgi:hypothetical protein
MRKAGVLSILFAVVLLTVAVMNSRPQPNLEPLNVAGVRAVGSHEEFLDMSLSGVLIGTMPF